jgi:DNA-binding CsgD family transcriptional regulator
MKHATELKTLLDSGLSYKEAASRLGITHALARSIACKTGLNKGYSNEAARNTMRTAKLMTEGKSEWEIAHALGLSPRYVSRLQLKGGLRETGKAGRPSERRPEQMKELLETGKSVTEVAASMGIKPDTVYQVCSRKGIKIPKAASDRKRKLDAEIRRLRELGINDAGVAHITGLNPELIYSYHPKRQGRPTNHNDELVAEALRRGEQVDDISLSLNLMPGTVVRYGQKNGYSFKKSYVLCEKEVAK